jgi:hypothetical protein
MPLTAAAFTMLAASGASIQPWPDAIDRVGILMYVAIAFGLPALGYVFMVIDFRRYLRSLRRALVVVANVAARATPYWAVRESQNQLPCFQSLEVTFPCSEQDVLAAYRRRVKQLHPDHGGDLQQFLRLQKHFEQAMHLARAHAKVRTVSVE